VLWLLTRDTVTANRSARENVPVAQPLITIDDARERILAATELLVPERVEIDEALDRVLARDVHAAGNVPPFPCSAMDGYAVIAAAAGQILRVIGESRAGSPAGAHVRDGEAIRISTGAAVPAGATAVIRQEDVREHQGPAGQPDHITTLATVAPGENVRAAGEAMRTGTLILRRGVALGPGELAAAVAAGAGHLLCGRRPRVAVLCTGDELREPGEPLGPGEIHNSNAPMLTALAARCSAISGQPQRLRDDRDATEGALAAAQATSDVIIVSGGVSVGPHDHVRPALAELGVREVFWGVKLQPGKPTWFGVGKPAPGESNTDSNSRLVFGLPGNPVSAFVTFTLFVAPALARLQGARDPVPPRSQALLAIPVRRNPQREQAIRVCLVRQDGETLATPTGEQGSHIMTSLLGADALAVIPVGDGELPAGAAVALEPLVR
jgi:molybdopterin molybdotransferase